MAYTYITNLDSPNFTPGRTAPIRAIVIHWWDDPARNPMFEGTIAWLCNPASVVSAHYVATGTGRRVACLVSDGDTAWHAIAANPSTIGIECDPRARDEDYDVVAELVADLWRTYGRLPLEPHRQHVTWTRCPGTYDLARLERLADIKFNGIPTAGDDEIRAAYLEILERPADDGGLAHYRQFPIDIVRTDLAASDEKRRLETRKAAEAQARADDERRAREAAESALREEQARRDEAARLDAERQARDAELAAQPPTPQPPAMPAPSVSQPPAKVALPPSVWRVLIAIILRLFGRRSA